MLGCDPKSESVGEGPESSSDSDPMTTAGSSTSGGSTSGASMSSTSGGDPMTSVGTTEAPGETGNTKLDVGDDETTGGPQSCEFEPLVIEFAESGKVLPEDVVDCGSVPLGSDAQAYVDIQDCILESSSMSLAYYAFIERESIDSYYWNAYSGSPGLVYAEARWGYDDYFGDQQLWMTPCTIVSNGDPMCTPGPELGLCLTCEGKSMQVCPAPR